MTLFISNALLNSFYLINKCGDSKLIACNSYSSVILIRLRGKVRVTVTGIKTDAPLEEISLFRFDEKSLDSSWLVTDLR